MTLNVSPARGKAGTRTWQLVSASTFSVVYFSINVISHLESKSRARRRKALFCCFQAAPYPWIATPTVDEKIDRDNHY
jgi:hypothetical protein